MRTAINTSSIDDGSSATRAASTGKSRSATTDIRNTTQRPIATDNALYTSNVRKLHGDHVMTLPVPAHDTGNTSPNDARNLPMRDANHLEPMEISSTTRKKIKCAARTVVKDGILKAIMGVRDVGVRSVGCSSLDGFGTAARAFGIPILGGFEKNLARKLLHERIHAVKLGHDAKFIPADYLREMDDRAASLGVTYRIGIFTLPCQPYTRAICRCATPILWDRCASAAQHARR